MCYVFNSAQQPDPDSDTETSDVIKSEPSLKVEIKSEVDNGTTCGICGSDNDDYIKHEDLADVTQDFLTTNKKKRSLSQKKTLNTKKRKLNDGNVNKN